MKLAAVALVGVTIPLAAVACTYSDASQLPFVQGPPPTTSAPELTQTTGNGPLTASVQPQGRGKQADRKVSDAVRSAMMNDPALAQIGLDRIRIETAQGKVTLAGIVATDAQHAAVVGRAKGVPGVVSVDDQVEVLSTL